jgi:hypothetical protein
MLSRSTAAIALLMAACTPSTAPPGVEAPGLATPGTAADATAQDTCNAARYRSLIGSNVSESTLSENADTRIVYPDSVVSQDFRPERLNVIVNAEGRVTNLECY